MGVVIRDREKKSRVSKVGSTCIRFRSGSDGMVGKEGGSKGEVRLVLVTEGEKK